MDDKADLMNQAQSAEDGATGIIRAAMDPEASAGNFYGPAGGWNGFPDVLTPEDLLTDLLEHPSQLGGMRKSGGNIYCLVSTKM